MSRRLDRSAHVIDEERPCPHQRIPRPEDGQILRDALGAVFHGVEQLSRTEYSLANPSPINRDVKNNQEKVAIAGVGQTSGNLPTGFVSANGLPAGATTITVTVTAASLTGDGLIPDGTTLEQDFALAVLNAHQ